MNLLNPSRRNARWLILLALLAYWAISLSGLDALPTVRDDEPWQAAPGYSFWTRGVYGSELFADFAGMGQHYYLFQPTFSLLLGLAGRLWGLGLFQIRIVPLMLGALTLCLTYRVGARLHGDAMGVTATCLLLLWRWGVSTPTLASGIPLLDISRIARYDTLVPVWGLSAWLMLSHAQQHGQGRHFFLAGLFAGLAGMAHLYGLFWVPALAIILFADSGWSLLKQRTIYALAAGAVVAWVPWLLFIAAGWDDFVLQTSQYANRFDLLSPSFYARNLLYETQRYGFGPTNLVSAASQPGVWLLVLGLPAALVWLSALSLSKRARAERPLVALVVPAWLFPLGFAVLLVQKTPGYLQSIAPLFAVVIAWVAVDLWQARRRRGLLVAAAMLVALDGGWGILHQQQLAADTTPYHTFMAEVRLVVPRSTRVVALHQYWLGLFENDFRSYSEVVFLSYRPFTAHPLAIERVLENIAPDVFILDSILGARLAEGDDAASQDALAREFAANFHAFMDRHHARELGRVTDKTYGTLIAYALSR